MCFHSLQYSNISDLTGPKRITVRCFLLRLKLKSHSTLLETTVSQKGVPCAKKSFSKRKAKQQQKRAKSSKGKQPFYKIRQSRSIAKTEEKKVADNSDVKVNVDVEAIFFCCKNFTTKIDSGKRRMKKAQQMTKKS